MTESWKQQPERSNRFWLQVIRWIALKIGRRFARLLLWPITLFFYLSATVARRASRDFLARTHGRPPTWLEMLRHLYAFAAVLLDRFYLLTDRLEYFDVRLQKPEPEQAARPHRGCIVFSSHFGSFDVMRVPATKWSKLRVRVLMDVHHGSRVIEMLQALNPAFAADVIDVGQAGPELVLQIKRALDQGDVIGIMADRGRSDDKGVVVDFMGGRARLPLSPWLLAMALKAPVFLGFGIYRGGNRYDLRFEKFSDQLEAPRGQRAEAAQRWAQQYADRLQQQVLDAPYNWFNFYDFWLNETAAH